MPRPKPHYRLVVTNLETKEQLRVELIDLRFVSGRSFRLRVNGRWASKMPVGSKRRCSSNCDGDGYRIRHTRWGGQFVETRVWARRMIVNRFL